MNKISSHTPAHSAPMRVQLSELANFSGLLREAESNSRLAVTALKKKTLEGRDAQAVLSEQIRDERGKGGSRLTADLEERRLLHIKTILSRAELLCRPKTKSLSRYSGDEGRFDDLSVLERAKGFMLVTADATLTADERQRLMDLAEHFALAEARVEAADY